jgi:hypothetical protein
MTRHLHEFTCLLRGLIRNVRGHLENTCSPVFFEPYQEEKENG